MDLTGIGGRKRTTISTVVCKSPAGRYIGQEVCITNIGIGTRESNASLYRVRDIDTWLVLASVSPRLGVRR